MKVSVVAFATASDVLGKEAVQVELPAGSLLSDLHAQLITRFPALEPMWPRLAVAVGGQLATADRKLEDGVEVALLPPVSGGAPGPDERVDVIDQAIRVQDVESMVADAAYGAVVLFLGTVRNHHQGRSVELLTYSAYRPMALEKLALIVRELEAAGEVKVAIVHRVGDVPLGQPSVVIAVASAHRAAAYEASRQALERLKREVPIWKREHYVDGDVTWREEEPLMA